jgi:hypothetical protein
MLPEKRLFPFDVLVSEVKFEAAVYELLRLEASIFASRLLYHRVPVQHVPPPLNVPQDIAGCQLFLFERSEGEDNMWHFVSVPKGPGRYVHILSLFVL